MLEHARAEAVEDGDVAAPGRLQQAGHAERGRARQLEGIAEVRVDAAEDDVDRLEAVHRLHPHPSLLDDEVIALDEREAEQHRGEGLVVAGLGSRATAQQHHTWRVRRARCQLLEGPAQRMEVRAEPPDRRLAVRPGEDLGHDPPVLHRVAGADRRLGLVGHDRPLAIGAADEVGRHGDEVPVAEGDAVGAPGEARMGQHELGRHRALGEQAARAVQVIRHRIEQPGPLGDTPRHGTPVRLGDHQRHGIERPATPSIRRAPVAAGVALGPALVGHGGRIEGDAMVGEQPVGVGAPRPEPGTTVVLGPPGDAVPGGLGHAGTRSASVGSDVVTVISGPAGAGADRG